MDKLLKSKIVLRVALRNIIFVLFALACEIIYRFCFDATSAEAFIIFLVVYMLMHILDTKAEISALKDVLAGVRINLRVDPKTKEIVDYTIDFED